MAGIGFRLRKIFEHDTYADNLRGVIIAATVAGGPIFFSILCLILLGIFSSAFISGREMELFLVTLVYIFAFSLISTGIVQLVVTRHLSDLIYAQKNERILPSFTALLIVTVACEALIALPFTILWDIEPLYKITAFCLFIVVGCNWQLLVFMSAVKNYRIIFFAFLTGTVISFVLALFFGKKFGLTGFLHGYTVGQIFLLYVMLARLFVEFKSNLKPDFSFLKAFKAMPQLVIIGFFYNLGIWVDKIIFWFSQGGMQVDAFLHAHLDYDSATFVAFLTTIPSYTYFLVKVETDFYGYFRAFFQTILNKSPYKEIERQKQHIARSVRESLVGLIKVQGIVTIVCMFFASDIARFFEMPVLGTMILEKTLIAVFLQMLLLTTMIFLLYFDIKLEAVVVTTVFMAANLILTVITLRLGYVFYGYGYLGACLLALVVAYAFLDRHLRRLEYHTFVSQPLI